MPTSRTGTTGEVAICQLGTLGLPDREGPWPFLLVPVISASIYLDRSPPTNTPCGDGTTATGAGSNWLSSQAVWTVLPSFGLAPVIDRWSGPSCSFVYPSSEGTRLPPIPGHFLDHGITLGPFWIPALFPRLWGDFDLLCFQQHVTVAVHNEDLSISFGLQRVSPQLIALGYH